MLTRNMLVLLVMALASAAMFAQGRGGFQIKRTNPSALSTPTGYTHVVEVSGPVRTIYLSGQIAFDGNGKLVGGNDMKAQAEQVFENLRVALASAGATFNDVVKMNMYTTDMSQIQAIRDVRSRYFRGFTPASTLVQVVHLARPELMLEVEVIAAVADSPRPLPASR